MDIKVAEAHDRLASLTIQLKEKEQENRITKLKTKELRRQLKHNQLQPLLQSLEAGKLPASLSQSIQKPPRHGNLVSGQGTINQEQLDEEMVNPLNLVGNSALDKVGVNDIDLAQNQPGSRVGKATFQRDQAVSRNHGQVGQDDEDEEPGGTFMIT